MTAPRRFGRLGATSPSGLALLPLRAFLGVTFAYAGVQKLSDPGFLHPGSSTYIGTQLRGFAHGTPGGFILRALALPHPQLAGVGVSFVEIGVGLLVLLGLFTRGAAAAGLLLSVLLFLTNSWHAYPYFLAPDIAFAFAWTPLVIGGASGQPALDHALGARTSTRRVFAAPPGGPPAGAERPLAVASRRQLMTRAVGLTGLGTLALGGLAAARKGSYRGPRSLGARTAGETAGGGSAGAPRAPASSTLPPDAVRVTSSRQLAPGQSVLFGDPADGSPDILIHHQGGGFTALSATCTHAGCRVEYADGQLRCPCHDSVFSARTGAAEQGPAVDPLPTHKVLERGGNVYVLRS